MAVNLQDQVVALHDCAKGEDVKVCADRAQNIVLDLQHLLLEDVSQKELDYCASILFDKDTGTVSFLRSTLSVAEFDVSKTECLKLIHSFLLRLEKKSLSYAVDIKTICFSMFIRERTAKVKVAAHANLYHIIEISAGSKVGQDLDVKSMVEKLFSELATKDSKLSAGVKRCIYSLLGKCAEVYPELVTGYANKLVEVYVRALKAEMTSKTKDLKMDVIAGCFEGLKSYLVNFTQSAEEGSKYSYDIFKYARMAINPTNDMHRYLVPKAALDLFARHADQFNMYMIDDYETVFEHLSFWSKHHNRDMLHAGLPALEAFLKQVSEMLVTRAEEGKKEGATFKFFVQQFRRVMDNPEATSKEVSLAINGYGYFAAPCRMFLTSEDVKFMFNDMIQRSEQIFLSINQEDMLDDGRLMSLPSFVEALASIIKELDTVTDSFIVSLEKLVVVLMQHFPRLNDKMHFICFRAIVKVFLALSPKGAVFNTFLAHVVYQGLIRTCSHPVVMATDEPASEFASLEEKADRDKPRISYRDYMPLWECLLDNSKVKGFGNFGVDMTERQALTSIMYDEIISAVLKMLSKLNLSSNKASDLEDELDLSVAATERASPVTVTSDPVEGLQASRPKDFLVLVNLVDFCRDFLPRKHCDEFVRWIYTFGHELTVLSTKFPLVSGFYKLLSVCLKMCTKTNYFKEMGSWDAQQDSMEVDSDLKKGELAERHCAYMLFSKFTKEVLERMKQYKDDLLAGCLSVILSLPQQIIEPQFVNIVPAVQLAFRLGLSYLPLALAALDAVDYWINTLPGHVMEPHYPQILPCLDAYLKSTDQGLESAADHTVALTSTKNKSSGKGKRKIPIKVLKGVNKQSQNQAEELQLSQVRLRCVKLLGSLGGTYNHMLVMTTTAEIAKAAVAWDRMKHLKFEVPFMDIKPVIYFDPFLPRIVELATTSSDRQTKVAACELLHSMVLYMLGRGAQQPRGHEEKFPMQGLYRKVFPAILLLACDVEQVSKQLFETLMMQLIHWFSNNRKFESEETAALLDTFMEGVENASNTSLRDLSARCIKEFLKWSIKQSTKKQMEKNPLNAKSLMKRIYSLALHPSAFKRFGAALAFNNVYTVIREEDELVNMFIFEILSVFVDSLALAHNDDKSLGTADQASQVLVHLERIIRSKADMLNKPHKSRRIPRNWPESTLDLAVRWLVRQCGRPQTECRHACMTLFCKLAPLLPEVTDAKAFFNLYLESDGPAYLNLRFESGMYKKGDMVGLTRCPEMTKMADTFSLKMALHWFDLFLAPLDCYTWVFGQDLLTPAQILSGGKTVLMKAVQFFLDKLAVEDIMSAAKLFHNKNTGIFTPKEVDDYNRAKCTAIIRIFDFLCVCLGKHPQEAQKVLPRNLWSDSLWHLMAACLLEPSVVGFNMADTEVMQKLPEETSQLLQILVKRLPKNLREDFVRFLKLYLKKDSCNLFRMMPLSLVESAMDHVLLDHVVSGYGQLHKVSLLLPSLQQMKTEEQCALVLLESVFDGMTCKLDGEKAVTSLTPVALNLARRLLNLAFLIGVKPKILLGKLLERAALKSTRGHSSVRHGAIFYTTFRKNINEFLIRESADFVPELVKHADEERVVVSSVLQSMLDQASRDKQQRKKEGQELAAAVLSNWSKLKSWWIRGANQETMGLALSLLSKVVLVDSKVTGDVKHGAFEQVFSMYCHMLTDNSTTITFKTKVLELLPFFTSLPSEQTAKIKSCLDQLIADNFPLKSSEFIIGSPKYNNYIDALRAILSALELSGSMMLLEIVISIFCRESKHVYEEQIHTALTRFVKRLPQDQYKIALDVPYGIFTDESGFPSAIRRSALERVCIPLLRIVRLPALTEFFITHIKEILQKIEAKQVKGSESALEAQIVTKMCCFELVELMYSRLPKEEVSSKDSRINSVYMDNNASTGKEMTTFLSKAANEAKRENMTGETNLLALRRQYHCAAYNALIGVISCTQTDVKFYTAFLFSDNVQKGQFLWDNIIDKNHKYNFEIEMASPLERRKRFVSIRNEVRGSRQEEDENEDVAMETPINYLASQYLLDSSLSEDVNQFDFTATGVSMSGAGDGGRRRHRSHRVLSSGLESLEAETSVTVTDDYVEMEMDELNQHECMATMTALLQHMKRNNISPELEKGTPVTEMPVWMANMQKKMLSSSTAANIKMFIAKLLVNAEEVFRPYAKFWLSPLVQLIVSGNAGGASINYFIMDVVVTILSWHTVAIPEDNSVDRAMANKLLEYLMLNCFHETRSILRNNLEVIKTLVEVWKARLQVPVKLIYDMFKNLDPKSKNNVTGIQLLAVMLANKLPPYTPNPDVEKDRFFHALAMNMMNNYKYVYAPAAEVVGMSLKYYGETARDADSSEWREGFMTNIEKTLSSFQMTKPDRFINCVFNLQKHFPPIADRFMSRLLFLLPKLHGEFRTNCLEVILTRVDHISDVYQQLKAQGLTTILTHRDEGTQHVALKIVHGMLGKLQASELQTVLPSVIAFSNNPSTVCRTTMYDIAMWVYDNYRYEESAAGYDDIMNQVKECLLKGLADEDLKNRLTVQNFWSDETRLPVDTLDRLVAMLEAMYSPGTEAHYLSYATNLLLEMTSKSPDYNREIFEHPLSECKFENYTVSSSWRQRHAAMTPLFVETQMSQGVSQSLTSGDLLESGQLRATQDVQQFTPTQEAGGSKAPYNWLTQSSLDTYADHSMSAASESQSSLLFSVGNPAKRRKPYKPTPSGFGEKRLSAGKDQPDGREGQSQDLDILRLKKRFLKDHEASRTFFMRRQARLKKMREEILKEQRLRRENQVTMYRKYRIGDLPDIQIKYSYIIAPLQALAQRDIAVARMLFSDIFKAIFTEIDNMKTERESMETVDRINICLNNMLNNSTQYFAPFVGCILDIAQSNTKRLKLEPSATNTACVTSLQQPLGIILLEDMLVQGAGEEPKPGKRARGAASTVSMETSSWIELARLYKSLGSLDVVRGIFSCKIGTQKITQDALEAEARGDYLEACKMYSEAMECTDWPQGHPEDVEVDMWDDNRLQCVDSLGQWQKLEEWAVPVDSSNSPQLDRLWEDTYYQEHYLPFFLRGKLKLLLDGKDQQTLLSFVDEAMKVSERKAVLESRHSEELSLMYFWQQDYDRANHYVSMAVDIFLQDWASMDKLMTSSRSARLQSLQKLEELQEFLKFITHASNFESFGPAGKLLKKWMKRSPEPFIDTPSIWDDIITNRCVYLDRMSEKISHCMRSSQQSRSEDSKELVKLSQTNSEQLGFEEAKVRLKLMHASSACEQENFPVALRQLKTAYKSVKEIGDGSLMLTWTHMYAKTHQRKCSVVNMAPAEAIKTLTGTLEQLAKHRREDILRSDIMLARQQLLLTGEAVTLATAAILEKSEFDRVPADSIQSLQSAVGCGGNTHQQIQDEFVERGFCLLREAVETTDQDDKKYVNSGADKTSVNQACLTLYRYCDKYIRLQKDAGRKVNCPSVGSFPVAMITSLMNAMKNDSSEARQYFPRLLQVIEDYPKTVDIFVKKASEVPCWMFISWISQMVALLDKSEAPAVHGILQRIEEDYPQALVYPMKISSDGFDFNTGSSKDKQNKLAVDKLNARLSRVPLVDKFIKALEQFGQPNALFTDWRDDMKKLLVKTRKNPDEIRKCYKDMYSELMDYQSGGSSQDLYGTPSQSEDSVQMGDYRRKFAQNFAKDLDKEFGKDGNKLLSMSAQEFGKKAIGIINKMTEVVRAKLPPPGTLKEYCTWMVSYQATDTDQDLEIPGQYTGLSKPMPEYHTKISSFDERVLVLSSIRKPKRIIIRGNDEKEYKFLVKGGEDLRQDQRIEQLFGLMNEIYARDAACKQRHLQLKTYQVIPMTPRVGLIEWVNNTVPLKDFLQRAMTEPEAKFYSSKGPRKTHSEWTWKVAPPKCAQLAEVYRSVYKKYSKTETIKTFRELESMVPYDLSRRAYLQMSSSPEAFYTLKCHFAVSHALVSISQYILGIGDRHLSNSMISEETGGIVGIDFGHSFGSATQFLPVPELMPFRLTRQLRLLMLPLKEKGLMESTMIHALHALRSSSNLLLSTMDVFIKEPSMDWQINAEKQLNTAVIGEDSEMDKAWYPKEKIRFAQRKLEGDNPAYITRDELKLGHGKSQAFSPMEKVLLGERKVDIRASLPERGLTIEQQVSCLIDQATDPNLLGRVYIGWEAWM